MHFLPLAAVAAALDWQQLFIQLGAFGVVAWVVVHILSRVMPKMTEQHAAERKDDREAYLQSLQKQRTDFLGSLDAERNARSELIRLVTGKS